MTGDSPYKVTLDQLESVHVPAEDQVEEHDAAPPVPDAKGPDERDREMLLRVGGLGL
jgi:hypothetical protein